MSDVDRPSWHAVKHRAVVPYSVWSNRITKGWDLEQALTTPAAVRSNRTVTVRRILAQQPGLTPNQIAKQMGRHVKPWEVRDIMSAIAAKDTITTAAAAAPPAAPHTKSTPSGPAWVHPIRRRALGLPVAPGGYATGS
jgi:hypothetical protein